MALLRVLALLAVLALATPIPGLAQAQQGGVEATDPSGDVKTELNGQQAAGGELAYPALDLLSLKVRESESSFAFTVGVAALPKDADAGADGVIYEVGFDHNGRSFLVHVQMALRAIVEPVFMRVGYRDAPTDEWSYVLSGNAVSVDAASNTFTVEVPRDLFADRDGAAPYPGRALEGLHVEARSLYTDADTILFAVPASTVHRVTDALPDAPPYPSLPVRFGLPQTGHARLSSDIPFRASNGEATTFLYEVTAHNLGDEADTFGLAAVGVPAGYTAVVAVPALALEAGANATVPVLLTMPFGHQHGDLATFTLEMTSLSDPGSVGRLQMGVRFLAIPQPAGHHDTIYLHRAHAGAVATPLFNAAYMNTLEDDPNDSGQNLYSSGFSGSAQQRYWWSFALSPTLEMGLDVDPDGAGPIRIPIGTTAPLLQATLSATLYVRYGDPADGGYDIGIAQLERTAPRDLSPNTQTLFDGQLVPMPDVGRIPYEPGRNLRLFVELLGVGAPTANLAEDGAFIAPGASLHVPLREWHDPVDELLASVHGPALSAVGPQERLVNPGESVVFHAAVANPGEESVSVRLEITGANPGWARLADASISVPAGGSRNVTVVVRAPADAVHGERADLVLQAYDRDDPTARGLLRLVATVDTSQDLADEAAVAQAAAGKQSPAPAVAFLALALAGLASRLRRQPR